MQALDVAERGRQDQRSTACRTTRRIAGDEERHVRLRQRRDGQRVPALGQME